MRVIIMGATGMVGGIVLKNCIAENKISEIISISRKSTGVSNDKLTEVLHQDFTNFSGLENHFQDIDAAYFCIGAYTGAVADDLFKKITVDFTVSFADILHQYSPSAKFCFLSGQGADPKEKSRISFARYKGMAENYLIKKEFGGLFIFRPGYIYPVEKRSEPNFSYRLFRRLYPLLKMFGKNTSITSEQLGYGLFKSGMEGAQKTILENRDILILATAA